jgi:hypothetical protein
MRVARRIRPSQVGCAATIGRRRLYAASATSNEPSKNMPQLARISLVIESDGQIVHPDDNLDSDLEQVPEFYASALLAPASARGR